jgi:hypothetical protein
MQKTLKIKGYGRSAVAGAAAAASDAQPSAMQSDSMRTRSLASGPAAAPAQPQSAPGHGGAVNAAAAHGNEAMTDGAAAANGNTSDVDSEATINESPFKPPQPPHAM